MNLAVIVTDHNRVTVFNEKREIQARGTFNQPLAPNEVEYMRSDPEGFMKELEGIDEKVSN